MAKNTPPERQARELAFRKALGERIRELRLAKEINQDDFADMAYLHRAHVGFIENARNDPNLATLLRIADALEIPLSELVTVDVKAKHKK